MASYDDRNTQNLNALGDYGKISFIQARQLVLIGDGHEFADVKRVGDASAMMSGDMVKKLRGSTSDFIVDHLESDRAEFEDAIHRLPGYERSILTYTR